MRASIRITLGCISTWGLTLSVACLAAEPRTYALVAAMGDQFSAVHEFRGTGSRLPNKHRRAIDAPDDLLNKLALASLDKAVAGLDPASQRIYFSIALADGIQVRQRSLEEAAFERALESLRAMPERQAWYRVVVITPTLRIERSEGGPRGDIQGVGVFTQPLCQSDIRDCDRAAGRNSGVVANTPGGEAMKAPRYVAPYLYAKVWILDPRTLAVIDTQVALDHTKLYDPKSDSIDMNQAIDRKVLAARIVEQVESSAAVALKRTELRGKVEVHDKGEVPAPAPR